MSEAPLEGDSYETVCKRGHNRGFASHLSQMTWECIHRCLDIHIFIYGAKYIQCESAVLSKIFIYGAKKWTNGYRRRNAARDVTLGPFHHGGRAECLSRLLASVWGASGDGVAPSFTKITAAHR